MSQEANKAVVRRYIEKVLNEGRLELIEELFAPVLHEAVREVATSIRATFPDMREEIETLIAEGDVVAARWIFRGTQNGPFFDIPPTGRSVEFQGLSMYYYLEEERIVDDVAVLDLLDAAEQLGASLAPPPEAPFS